MLQNLLQAEREPSKYIKLDITHKYVYAPQQIYIKKKRETDASIYIYTCKQAYNASKNIHKPQLKQKNDITRTFCFTKLGQMHCAIAQQTVGLGKRKL